MRQFSSFKQMLFNSVFTGMTLLQLVPEVRQPTPLDDIRNLIANDSVVISAKSREAAHV